MAKTIKTKKQTQEVAQVETTVNTELDAKIAVLQGALEKAELSEEQQALLKAKRAEGFKNKTAVNACYTWILDYCERNNLTMKPLAGEFHKQYIKYNGKNIAFIFFKKHDKISLYTSYKLSDKSAFSTYNKKLCYFTELTSLQVKDNFNEIITTSINAEPVKIALTDEIKAEIAKLQAQKVAQKQ